MWLDSQACFRRYMTFDFTHGPAIPEYLFLQAIAWRGGAGLYDTSTIVFNNRTSSG